MMKLIVAFRNFVNVPKKCVIQININIHICLSQMCNQAMVTKWGVLYHMQCGQWTASYDTSVSFAWHDVYKLDFKHY